MLKQHDNDLCPGKGFYTYDAFIAAAKYFPGFGTARGGSGNDTYTDTRKREVAAFLAQTSHETMLGWEAADGGFTVGAKLRSSARITNAANAISVDATHARGREDYALRNCRSFFGC